MDPNTIDYALGKISEIWEKAMPSINNVTDEYIQFKVVSNFVATGFIILVLVILIFLARYFYKKYKEKGYDSYGNYSGTQLAFIITCGIIVAQSIVTLDALYKCIMLFLYPKMYVIQSILNSVAQ